MARRLRFEAGPMLQAARWCAVVGGAFGLVVTAMLVWLMQQDARPYGAVTELGPGGTVLRVISPDEYAAELLLRRAAFVGVPGLASLTGLVTAFLASAARRREAGVILLASGLIVLAAGVIGTVGVSAIAFYFFPGALLLAGALFYLFL